MAHSSGKSLLSALKPKIRSSLKLTSVNVKIAYCKLGVVCIRSSFCAKWYIQAGIYREKESVPEERFRELITIAFNVIKIFQFINF